MSAPKMTRRSALITGAALPLAAGIGTSTTATAGGHSVGPANAVQNTFSLGEFQVSTLLAGTRTVTDDPQGTFGMNVDKETFEQVSRENFIPADQTQFFFTPTVVRAGEDVVLFDTGLSAAGTTAALEQAGLSAEDITVVVITHMHGDHVGGMTTEAGDLTYPNARFVAGDVEYNHWSGQNNETVGAKITPFADRFEFVGDGASVVSGITGMAAFGHTPGHMVYRLESGGEQLMIMADTANHYVWSLAYPDWEVRFDTDKAAAAATRRSLLDMLATDRIPMIGYHMPFPGTGYVDTRPDGRFHYVPTSYQFML
ncbi:MBL fold metallo-hydrolase [Alphaproteobacteria bacterium GH1-50]|uniref:MBL fold metallo-hydrolase n=1 Tax=Kangsaoukella pontilimi TaxID=2691042 RepID=A0A7C9IJS1_9RHOB|nr:MBL fold metallo-hydrolase [Kangsaoukella pontilimi]MXQ09082.1 MBL fold metallo-hydrolase [Kangsaoukella pontilimi]